MLIGKSRLLLLVFYQPLGLLMKVIRVLNEEEKRGKEDE